jgi:hypothetical protein
MNVEGKINVKKKMKGLYTLKYFFECFWCIISPWKMHSQPYVVYQEAIYRRQSESTSYVC